MNESGFCRCGCGQKTKICPTPDKRRGYAKGDSRDYIFGHANKLPYSFVLEERGYSSPCWIWNRHINRTGYGMMANQFHDRIIKSRYAHRHFYTLIFGPIPDGLQLDHLCRVRCCVNPNHLEPVTAKENTLRSPIKFKITDQIRKEMMELRKSGMKMRDVATQFKISRSSVIRIYHEERERDTQ